MSDDVESGKRKGGMFSALRRMFGGGKTAEVPATDDGLPLDLAGTVHSDADAPGEDEIALTAPQTAGDDGGDEDDDDDDKLLVLSPTMQPEKAADAAGDEGEAMADSGEDDAEEASDDPEPSDGPSDMDEHLAQLEAIFTGRRNAPKEETADEASDDSAPEDEADAEADGGAAALQADTEDQSDTPEGEEDGDGVLAGAGADDELENAAEPADDLSVTDAPDSDPVEESDLPGEGGLADDAAVDEDLTEVEASADDADDGDAVLEDAKSDDAAEATLEDTIEDDLSDDGIADIDVAGFEGDEADVADIDLAEADDTAEIDDTADIDDGAGEPEVDAMADDEPSGVDDGPDSGVPDSGVPDSGVIEDATSEDATGDDDGLIRAAAADTAAFSLAASKWGSGPSGADEVGGGDPFADEAVDAEDAGHGHGADAGISGAALEETVRRVLREELAGEIGQRLSRNIQRMIRDEIARMK